MGFVNDFIIANAGIMSLLVFLIILVVLAVLVRRAQRQVSVRLYVDDAVDRLYRAAEHYADVSSVVAMMRQLDELDTGAIELIKSYPKAVQAAALLHFSNVLGADLQAAQRELSESHQRMDLTYVIDHRQERVDMIRAKLDKVVEMTAGPF